MGNVTEWHYNAEVARLLDIALERRGIDAIIVDDYERTAYGSAIRRCAQILRGEGVTHALELHFNSAGPSATGAEWLHWHSSSGGKRLAEAVRAGYRSVWPDMADRGTKGRNRGQRGSTFLRLTHCPAIICEPFFGSNEDDWWRFSNAQERLAHAYAEGLAHLRDTESRR